MESIRSKKTFFISECLVNQNLRAYGVGNMKGEGPNEKILEPGTFVESIQAKLQEQNLDLEFIGVRMKDLDLVLSRIKKIISEMK